MRLILWSILLIRQESSLLRTVVFLQATATYIASLGWLDFSHTLLSHFTATISVTFYVLHYLAHPLNTCISTHLICRNARQGQGWPSTDKTIFHKPVQFLNFKTQTS